MYNPGVYREALRFRLWLGNEHVRSIENNLLYDPPDLLCEIYSFITYV